jgi:hypothetical protein
MSKPILYIDGDICAYMTAAACEKKTIIATHLPSGKSKPFKNKTELKKLLKEKGKELTNDYQIKEVQEAIPVEQCIKSLQQKIQNIVSAVEPDEYFVLIGGINNFRDKLPLPSKYKGSRKDILRPVHLKACLNYLRDAYRIPEINGWEADDELSILGYTSLSQGNKAVIATLDKDVMQGNGLLVYNETIKEPPRLIDELGELYLKIDTKGGKTVKGSGLKFLCFQWIFGDTSDCYSPYELSNYSFGQLSAYDRLVDCKTVPECLEVVIKTFKDFYPIAFEYLCWQGLTHKADWYTMLELYFKCCWMKRSYEDPSDPLELFSKYGIQLTDIHSTNSLTKETT